MTTITLPPQLSERIAFLAAQTGKTQEQVIAAAVAQFNPTERAIPELSPETIALMTEINTSPQFNDEAILQRYGMKEL
ncbi:hypothetical protein [Alysiella filiformis]|uniref:Ribbon-helix-helix protein, copG family n=1 Tax=Alysiella filiformis DSM 16848 TaxID=1120981 RepID=A0A286E6T1_9NEIS|nr:hypothetical protein [Alysiella filiformis]QMT31531.1 hypothetical protein H3L97_01060 [Alysiella filiformis]UBQ55456.1 hypothetical protein JF568_07615 [Alysiella filiformis DSM 16848]SOD66617.1 hypothetical protein SAMN02746062_00669 [Alysiella filiformis DSM 16848]